MNLWTYDGYRDTKHYIVDTAMITKSRLSSIYWSNTDKRMNLWTYDGYRDTKHYIVDTAMITKSKLSSIYWSKTYKG